MLIKYWPNGKIKTNSEHCPVCDDGKMFLENPKKRTGRLGGVLKYLFIFDGLSSWITGLLLKTGPQKPILLFLVFCRDDTVNPAARSELARYLHPPWFAGSGEIVQDAIDYVLIEDAHIAIGLKVEFETLQFDAAFVGDVFDFDGPEVRLAGFGADGGELRRDVLDNVIALRMRIVECFNIRHSAIQVTLIARKSKGV